MKKRVSTVGKQGPGCENKNREKEKSARTGDIDQHLFRATTWRDFSLVPVDTGGENRRGKGQRKLSRTFSNFALEKKAARASGPEFFPIDFVIFV